MILVSSYLFTHIKHSPCALQGLKNKIKVNEYIYQLQYDVIHVQMTLHYNWFLSMFSMQTDKPYICLWEKGLTSLLLYKFNIFHIL